MRIEFQTEGGLAYFPGLSRPVSINTDTLPQEEAADLARQVQAARFFDLPVQPRPTRRGAADYRQYTITVEEGGRQHTVQLADPITDPALQALVQTLQSKVRAQRAETGGSDQPSEGQGKR